MTKNLRIHISMSLLSSFSLLTEADRRAGPHGSAVRSSLLSQGAGQLVERNVQLTSDPCGDGEARFPLVLLEIGEVGLCHLRTGRKFGLGQSVGLARRADLLPERRRTLGRGLAPALDRQEPTAFGENLVPVLLDELAQASGRSGFSGGQFVRV